MLVSHCASMVDCVSMEDSDIALATQTYAQNEYTACPPAPALALARVLVRSRRGAMKRMSPWSAAMRLNCGVNWLSSPVPNGEPAAGSAG